MLSNEPASARSTALGKMIAAFQWDWGSAYSWAVLVIVGYLLWSAAFEKGHQHFRWIRRKLFSAPPGPPQSSKRPAVVLGHPGASISLTPLHDLAEGEHSRVIKIEPHYVIENKDALRPIRDVMTGVRRRDGREHTFEKFRAPMIGPKESAQVRNVGSIPLKMLDGLHEANPEQEFLYWARFEDEDGQRWEVVYDPLAKRNDYIEQPTGNPRLDAEVRKRERASYFLDIENTGDVAVARVECVLPDEAVNWELLTDALPAYPIRVLEPGDSIPIPLAVTMGGPAAAEVTLRGTVGGAIYTRQKTLALYG